MKHMISYNFPQRIKNRFNDFFDNIPCKTLDFKVESRYTKKKLKKL